MKLAKCVQILTVIVLLSLTAANVFAAAGNFQIGNQAPNNDWHFLFAPYGWMPNISGDVTVKNNTYHAFVPFSEILKNLDFAGEAHLEANKGSWTFMVDPTYLKMTLTSNQSISRSKIFPDNIDVNNTLNANETLTTATTLIDGGIFYRLLATAPSAPQFATLELLAGGRYIGFNNAMEFKAQDNLHIDEFTFTRLTSLNVSGTTQLAAPIVGARIKYDPTNKVDIWLRGDGGGFNVDNMQSTWNASAGIGYTVHSHIDIGLAYRVLDIKFTKVNAGMNILMYGPQVGIAFYS